MGDHKALEAVRCQVFLVLVVEGEVVVLVVSKELMVIVLVWDFCNMPQCMLLYQGKAQVQGLSGKPLCKLKINNSTIILHID